MSARSNATTLNAIQNYVATTLDGREFYGLPPTNAWVLPPPLTQPAENPQIYVWGGRLAEKRATLPRGQGQKRILHQIDIYVHWTADYSNTDLSVGIFPVLLDGLRGIMRAVQLPVQLTDNYSGEISQLTDFGEEINLAYTTPVTLADQRWLINIGQLKLSAREWINPA